MRSMNTFMPLLYFLMIGMTSSISLERTVRQSPWVPAMSPRLAQQTARSVSASRNQPGSRGWRLAARGVSSSRVPLDHVERHQTPIASVDPPAVADGDPGGRRQPRRQRDPAEVGVPENQAYGVERQRSWDAVSKARMSVIGNSVDGSPLVRRRIGGMPGLGTGASLR